MRIFGSDRIARLMDRLKMEEGEEIKSPLVSRAIETAQRRVESHNFDIRKWLIKYDDVMNKQREVIYDYRQKILEQQDLLLFIEKTAREYVHDLVNEHVHQNNDQDLDISTLVDRLIKKFCLFTDPKILVKNYEEGNLEDYLWQVLSTNFQKKVQVLSEQELLNYISYHLLDSVDKHWKENLYVMDELRESVGLRAYGQIDPLHEYKKEGHQQFFDMFHRINEDAVLTIFSISPADLQDLDMNNLKQIGSVDARSDFFKKFQENLLNTKDNVAQNKELESNDLKKYAKDNSHSTHGTYVRTEKKIGRNELCLCGSGKKYKKCCGV